MLSKAKTTIGQCWGGPQDHPQVQQFTNRIQHVVVILMNIHCGDIYSYSAGSIKAKASSGVCHDPRKPPMLSSSCEGILPTRGENAIIRLQNFSLEFRVL